MLPSSSRAACSWSSPTGLPCRPSLSSRNETPRPFLVLATIRVGSSDCSERLGVGVVDLFGVVAVDLDRVPAEGLGAGGVVLAVPAVHRLPGLAEAVHVEDGCEVVELVVGGVLEGLPHRALGHLGVAAEHPDPVGKFVQVLAGECYADAYRQSLAEGARCHVDPWYLGRRVALQAAVERAEGQELLVGDRARRLVHRVEQAVRRDPWRRSGGRCWGSRGRRSRSGGTCSSARPGGRPRTWTRWGAPTRRPSSSGCCRP